MKIKNIKHKLHDSKIKNALSIKLGWIFAAVALIMIIVSLIFVFIIISIERKRYAEREAENVLNSLSTNIGSDIKNYKNLSRLLMTEARVKTYMKASRENTDFYALSENARLGILDILNISTNVDSVFIFRNDLSYTTTLNTLEYRLDWNRIFDSDWKQKMLELKGGASITLNGDGVVTKMKEPYTLLTINRAIYDNVSQKQTGYILLNLSTAFIEDEISKLNTENICICTTDGVYLVGNEALMQYYSGDYSSENITISDEADPPDAMMLSGLQVKDYPIVILYSIRNGRRLLPIELLYITLLLPLVYFVCVIVAAWFIKKNITNPIFRLTSEMEKNRQEEKLKKIDIDLPQNEIGMLKDTYNNMVDHTTMLLNRLLENEQTIQKAEMRVLQEQIKPHFLYNSLETIGYLAIDAKAEKVHSALETLGSFYRNFLSKGDREIPLKREITIIKDYISLQKLRYGDIINDEYDIAENTQECIIPKLILQPLVENSIYHGIRMKGETGTIKISSSLDEDGLHIIVRDTGIGMTQEQIDKVLSIDKTEDSDPFKTSFGLWGTIRRIRSYCDSNDIVRIRSEEGEFTEIEFILPYDMRRAQNKLY